MPEHVHNLAISVVHVERVQRRVGDDVLPILRNVPFPEVGSDGQELVVRRLNLLGPGVHVVRSLLERKLRLVIRVKLDRLEVFRKKSFVMGIPLLRHIHSLNKPLDVMSVGRGQGFGEE